MEAIFVPYRPEGDRFFLQSSGGIVGVFSLGMFSTRANGFGAVSGALISMVVVFYVKFYTSLHWQILLPVAISSCMASGYLLSFVSPQLKNLEGLTVFTPKQKALTPETVEV